MSDAFEHFACYSKLPVPIEFVKEHILECGTVDTIRFIKSDIDPSIMQGLLRVARWKPPYGEMGVHAEIYYSGRLPLPNQRIVVCKEMLHLLDNHDATAKTWAVVERLITEVSAPLSLLISVPGLTDHMGVFKALCVLLPRDALAELRGPYRAGKINAETVASLAQIPEEYVNFVMSPTWEKVVETIR